ncbi:hypothetical protein [Leptolyngbya sp. ST-U4]|uniref:hypothetical protein n=1 Tax=Leptolyngbya sp. ST-U4 TaxID=2933912 RepID=UPI00329946EB
MPSRPMNSADSPPPPSDSPFRDTHFFSLDQGDLGGLYFLVDMPSSNVSTQYSEYQREAFFNRVRDQFIGTDYRLLNEQSLSQDGYPGQELESEQIEQSGQAAVVARTRVYLTDRRVYLLQVTGSPEVVHSPEAERFLNSFKRVSSTP